MCRRKDVELDSSWFSWDGCEVLDEGAIASIVSDRVHTVQSKRSKTSSTAEQRGVHLLQDALGSFTGDIKGARLQSIIKPNSEDHTA